MPDNTAVTQPDGSTTAVDTSEIDDTKADLLAQAVGQMVDGAEAEAAQTLLLLADELDGKVLGRYVRRLRSENERLRDALEQIAEPMAGSADRETWQDLAELRAQIAEDALDGDKDRYPTDQEWESSLQRAERVKKKHASLFDRLAQEDDESADDRRTDYSETLEQQAARQRERVDELEAEVERLRGTLQKIANVPVFGRQAKPSKSTIRDWARNALDGAGDDDE